MSVSYTHLDVYKRQAPHTGDVVKVSSGVGKFTCGLRYQ